MTQNQLNTTCVFDLPVQHATVIFKCEIKGEVPRKLLTSTATGVFDGTVTGGARFRFLDITFSSDRRKMAGRQSYCRTS